jgi:inner membrane protein
MLPQRFVVDAELVPEIRKRGLYEVPVYTANTVMSGNFSAPDTSGLGIDHAVFDWSRAYFALPVSDARAIRNAPAIRINDAEVRFEASGSKLGGLPPHVIAPAGEILDASLRANAFDFSLDLDLGGTQSIHYLPLGDTTEVSMKSSWSSPSFVGTHLPETRTITDDGFTASWRVASLGRTLPSRWTTKTLPGAVHDPASFGVSLFVPVGVYQMTDRATKYAVLFIGLTFVTFFLFEVLVRLRLHPLQYLLVGFANILFYLLLLSLSEHVGFGASYFVSAMASTGLVGFYSSSILHGWRRTLLVVAMLSVLYGFLYLTLRAESLAMLAGTIALWLGLGLVMYLTRHIDWYSWGSTDDSAPNQEELFAASRT